VLKQRNSIRGTLKDQCEKINLVQEAGKMTERLEEKIYQIFSEGPEMDALWWKGTWWKRKDIRNAVEKCVEQLEKSGFRKGYRIATMMPNCPLISILSLAVWKLGGTMVPLNAKMGPEILLNTLSLVEPAAIVLFPGMEKAAALLESKGMVPVISPLEGPLPSFTCGKCSPEDPSLAVIFATSGTSGMPKAVRLTHSNILDNTIKTYETFQEFTPEDNVINVLPNFHVFGYDLCTILPLVNGLKQTVVPSFMPIPACLQAMIEAKVTVIAAVPTMYSLFLTVIAKGHPVPDTLRFMVSGGDKLDLRIAHKAEEMFGAQLLEGYGLTECSPIVSANWGFNEKTFGTVGYLLPECEAQLRDIEGNVLPQDQEGILWVKGPSVTEGYFRSPEITAQRIVDGWFNTGDIATFDEQGRMKILDRAGDLIIVGGFNVYPQEVEMIIKGHPHVQDAGVVGVRHHMSGEYVKAFVVLREGAETENPRDIINFCKGKLSHYKIPRKIEFVEELPYSDMGKLLRRKLRSSKK
jgi:long-chain acyl-CoA synthetase